MDNLKCGVLWYIVLIWGIQGWPATVWFPENTDRFCLMGC